METVKVGQHVYWTDPDGDMESGNGKVVALQHESVGNDTIISLKMMDGGEVECTLCELSPFRGEYYAELKWHFSDVQTLIDGVSDEEAEAWLFRNAKHLRDRLCELGFEVMDTLLSLDPPKRETDND